MEKARPAVAALLTVLAVMAIASLVTSRKAESSDAGRVGRYQIVAGCYDSTVGAGLPGKGDETLPRRGVFRIDTATGETWVLIERIDKSSVVEDKYDREWVSID